MANTLTLELTVSGQLGKFPLSKEKITFVTSGKALTGPKVVPVPAAAPAASVSVALEGMSQQLVLVLCATERITYQINGDGVNREIAEGAFAVHPGNPVITRLSLGGNGLTDAEVSIFQVGKEGTPPTPPPAAAANSLHLFTPVTAGQTVFTLPSIPANPGATVLFIAGVMYTAVSGFFTLVGNTLTWLDVPFIIPDGARVEVHFQ